MPQFSGFTKPFQRLFEALFRSVPVVITLSQFELCFDVTQFGGFPKVFERPGGILFDCFSLGICAS